MSKTVIKVGPQDHGRRMSLEDFDRAEVQEGYLYELGRGFIVVSDVPAPPHLAMVNAIRRQLVAYDLANPGKIYCVASGSECKLLLPSFQSERHPDLSVYKTPPPSQADVWAVWVPEIVIEVVSPTSRNRDYKEKPEEYLDFGVSEYWVFDGDRREMLVHRRSQQGWAEKIVRPPRIYKTRLLPGLAFDCGTVFAAAAAID